MFAFFGKGRCKEREDETEDETSERGERRQDTRVVIAYDRSSWQVSATEVGLPDHCDQYLHDCEAGHLAQAGQLADFRVQAGHLGEGVTPSHQDEKCVHISDMTWNGAYQRGLGCEHCLVRLLS
eukprot:1666775-Rhodomonas_salina.6